MVSTPVLLGQNSNATASPDTTVSDDLIVTLSRAFESNELGLIAVIVAVSSGSPTAPTVSGGGVSWSLVETNPYRTLGTPQATLYLFAGKSATPSGTTITVTPAAAYRIAIAQVIGIDGASEEFVQLDSATFGAGTATGVIMEPMADTTNNAFVGFVYYSRSASLERTWSVDTEAGYTFLGKQFQADGNGTSISLGSLYGIGIDDEAPGVGAALSGGVDYLGATVLEITEATGPAPGQIALPSTVSSAGNYQTDDESTDPGDLIAALADDDNGTYIESEENPDNDTFEFVLENIDIASGISVRYSYGKSVGDSQVINQTVQLLTPDGQSVLKQWTHNNVGVFPQEATQDISDVIVGGAHIVRLISTAA